MSSYYIVFTIPPTLYSYTVTDIPEIFIKHFSVQPRILSSFYTPRTGGSSLGRRGQESRGYLEKAQTLRQNQVSLCHIYLSATVWLPASPQRKLSSGLCSRISRYRMARKRGQQTHVRERERLLLNAISGH